MKALLTTVLTLTLLAGFRLSEVRAGGAVGTMAPGFTVENVLDTQPDFFSLEDYRASVVVIAFFPPYRSVGSKVAAPAFKSRIVNSYSTRVVFLGIGDANPGTVSSTRLFAKEFGYDFPCAFDTAFIFLNYETRVENFFVIGPDGRIVFRAAGTGADSGGIPFTTTEPRLKAAIDSALATPTEGITWSAIKALFR